MTGRRRSSSFVEHISTSSASCEERSETDSGRNRLREEFLVWLGDQRLLLLVPLYTLFRGWNLYFLSPEQDTQRYFDIGGRWLLGQTPYRQIPCEYPPGALPFFALPRSLTTLMLHTQQEVMAAYHQFCKLFAGQMVIVDLLILWLIGRLASHLYEGKGTLNHQTSMCRGLTTCAQAIYIVCVSSLGTAAFQRFDLAFSASLLLFVIFAFDPKRRFLADAMLGISIWIKVASLPLAPLYWAYLWTEHNAGEIKPNTRASSLVSQLRAAIHVAAPSALRVGGVLAVLFAPFWYIAGSELFNFVQYQSNRGLHIESTYASVLMFFHLVFAAPLARRFAFGASEVVHPSSENLAQASGLVLGLAVALALVAWLPRQRMLTEPVERRLGFLEGILGTLLIILATNKVFSPQFLLWVAPFFGLLIFSRRRFLPHDMVAIGTIQALTVLLWHFYYINLLQLEALPATLLLVRNLCVGAAGLALVGLSGPKDLCTLRDKAQGIFELPRTRWLLGGFAVAMAGIWVFAANMSETTANDIWIQLRSGADIWRSFSVPQVEQYSATVSGRPFLAHEWLSGLWFFLADKALGDMGLSFLTAATAFAIFVVLYFAFEPRTRRTFWYLPLVVYINYLIAFRLLARPHIFTILAQALMVTAIERWRRSGRISSLLGLIPMQVVWINLHGAALFGPALMGMVSGCVGLMAFFPELARSEKRPIGWRDFFQTSGLTLALILACLVNPYGVRIVTFSLDLMGNEYAKNRVWEWTTPFLGMNTYYYWLYIFIILFVVLWASLAYRIKEIPILDASYVLVASYLGLRANRFMPDFAILAFPVVARSFEVLMKEALPVRLHGRRPWFDIGMAVLLFTNCAVYGYAHSAREHRPLFGWGYGGDMPFVEVDLLKKLKLRGTIYNEYSDGSLIINRLVPDIKPVLDSRIDLYPLDFVEEYDRAYLDPQLFARFLKNHHCNIVMLYKTRTSPAVLRYLTEAPEWRLLLDTNGRVLFATEKTLVQARHREGLQQRASL